MPLFKSKTQKAQEARAADTQHPEYHDAATAPQGTGVSANDFAQNNTHAPEHINTVNRHGGTGYQGNAPQDAAPGAGYAAGTGHHHGHHGGAIDRAEQRVEAAVGARAVRSQVGDKEQEVNAIKAQSAELAEAERLEREAKMHRDRAVAGGAHPDNQRLGAGWQT